MRTEYVSVQKWLHWLIAAGALATIALGVAMLNVGEGGLRDRLFSLHKSVGVAVLGLMALRLAALARWATPRMARSLPRAQRRAARTVHLGLYALLVVTPLLGWFAISAGGADRTVFGVATLPKLWSDDPMLAEALYDAHDLLGLGIVLLTGMHVIGAFWHLLILKDGVFERMWFRFTQR